MGDPPVIELTHWDDAALIQQVQRDLQGRTAFAELYRRYVHRVYRYLLAQVGNEQDAQDLTAQTFLKALESMPTYRGDSAFSTWLFGIAYHRAMDHFRRRRNVIPLEEAEDLSDSEITPEEMVGRRLQLETVLRLMPALAKERAEALALHSFGGLSIGEVAAIMHKNETAVRMLIHRAIRDLQQRLAFSAEEVS